MLHAGYISLCIFSIRCSERREEHSTWGNFHQQLGSALCWFLGVSSFCRSAIWVWCSFLLDELNSIILNNDGLQTVLLIFLFTFTWSLTLPACSSVASESLRSPLVIKNVHIAQHLHDCSVKPLREIILFYFLFYFDLFWSLSFIPL